MCGRYTVSSPGELVAELFELDAVPALEPRYNVAPTQEAPVIRVARSGRRRLDLLRWGLIPYWAKERSIGNRLINARAETAADKPSFRWSLRRRRCLVVGDGFYEWQRRAGGKQPYLVRLAGGGPLAFAGLWDRWRPPGEPTVESFTILTTAANELVAPVHDRMPVILPQAAWRRWLDPAEHRPEQLRPMLAPLPAAELELYPVSSVVNSPAHDSPDCVAPLDRSAGV